MSDPASDSPQTGGLSPSLYLDYGADGHDCDKQGFEICERGMRFASHWQFSLGTQLAVSFAYQDGDGQTLRVTTEGIIVDCELIACKCYYTTLLFLELPESLREVVRNANPRIEASVMNKGEARTIPYKPSLN